MKISSTFLVASITLLIILAGAARAEPDFGPNCAICHGRADGAFNFLPSNLLQIPPGQTRGITINVTDAATNVNSALSLTGLNAAGLGATADASWTHQEDDYWTLGPFGGIGQKSLSLTLPAGAVDGSYPINVILAGGAGSDGGRRSRTGSFTVQVAPAGVPGDYNGNDVVDAADYVVWRNNLSMNVQLQNEVASTTPGTVTQEDYTAWRARFGNTTGAGSVSFAIDPVPEPATVMLAVLGLLAIYIFHSRRH